MDNRDDIRDFLATRRAKLTPVDVGLPTSARRRVPGLRREEVAVLAGASTEWYTKLEKGHIAGVSEEVLVAVADALRVDDNERTYLLDLARAAKPARRQPTRRREVPVPAQVQWMLDSITMSAAFIRNGRLDVIGVNALGGSLHAPTFDSPTARGRRANFARYHFLDPGSREFFLDWEGGAAASVALLRAEAGRAPYDMGLRELIGELSTVSEQFSAYWGSHDILIRHEGRKGLQPPAVGEREPTYESTEIPLAQRAWHDLTFCTAEPGTAHEERLRLLASWHATGAAQEPDSGASLHPGS
ncbi:helix-turn-helix domain-containing protein [Kocuria palustris]|uniref:helix-turn-helix domain-containing protein n=1 Tax=Kocuria palustris TaxID=71999 RepID=UPI002430E9E8|nr:helix-turn-helix transcriptional regulator [Kocuria palustris]